VQTLKSFVNDTVRLSVYSIQNSVSFIQAREICQKCADGELVKGNESSQLMTYLPTWLDVLEDQSILYDIENRNGSQVDVFERDIFCCSSNINFFVKQ